tara:strand:- start:36 stop:623 length:588 start_codon:yes stop_codon:yes gene_type:complete
MTGAKIAKKYENPIDNFIVHHLCEPISDNLYYYNVTPNMITLLGFIISIIGAISLYNYKIYQFMFLNTISYYCDCLDGYMARKYKLQTKFGDYFDHITDNLQVVIIIGVLIIKYRIFYYPKLIIFSLGIIGMLLITQGCQEALMKKENNSLMLTFTTKLCNKNAINNINILRFFGAGTSQLYVLIITYYLWFHIK